MEISVSYFKCMKRYLKTKILEVLVKCFSVGIAPQKKFVDTNLSSIRLGILWRFKHL